MKRKRRFVVQERKAGKARHLYVMPRCAIPLRPTVFSEPRPLREGLDCDLHDILAGETSCRVLPAATLSGQRMQVSSFSHSILILLVSITTLRRQVHDDVQKECSFFMLAMKPLILIRCTHVRTLLRLSDRRIPHGADAGVCIS